MNISRLLIGLTVLILTNSTVHADGTVASSTYLRAGKTFTVRGSRCTLRVVLQSPSRMRFKCTGSLRGTRSSSQRSVTLIRQDSFTVRAKNCDLSAQEQSARRITVACLQDDPNPTVSPTLSPSPEPSASASPSESPTASASPTPTPTLTPNAHLLLDTQQLVSLNTSTPDFLGSPVSISGLAAGQVLVAIDRRPVNGFLYGLAYNASAGSVQLYHVAPETGLSLAVGNTGSFVDVGGNPVRIGVDSSTTFSIDFEPIHDRLRVITNSGQNFRINPDTGAFVDGDGGVSGVNMDGAISGTPPAAQQIAFSGNVPWPNGEWLLYALDASSDKLAHQALGTGVQTEIASLSGDFSSVTGFDIPVGSLSSGYMTGVTGGIQKFFELDLESGAATPKGVFPNSLPQILSLAVHDLPFEIFVGFDGTNIVTARSDMPQYALRVTPLTGLTAGETVVGGSRRPSNGRYVVLGINSAAETGTLYTVDTYSGALEAVGSPGSVAFVNSMGTPIDFPTPATGYGIDVNPITGGVHVVTGNGLHFRINPTTGGGVDGNSNALGIQPDTSINGVASSLVSIAFTNSALGATATTAYGLDATLNSLVIMSSTGETSHAIPVTDPSGTPIDFDSSSRLEIPTRVRVASSGTPVTSGIAFAYINSSLYQLDLTTGKATIVREFSWGPWAGFVAAASAVD